MSLITWALTHEPCRAERAAQLAAPEVRHLGVLMQIEFESKT